MMYHLVAASPATRSGLCVAASIIAGCPWVARSNTGILPRSAGDTREKRRTPSRSDTLANANGPAGPSSLSAYQTCRAYASFGRPSLTARHTTTTWTLHFGTLRREREVAFGFRHDQHGGWPQNARRTEADRNVGVG